MTQLKQFPLRQPRRPALGLWLVLALLVAPLRATPAAANVVITDCTTSLDLAVALNGPNALITFSCGPAPVTITITQDGGFNVVDGSAFTIDGGNRVTLSGGNNNRVFNVAATAALTLTNIILNHGYAASGGPSPVDEGGALLNNGGTLALINTIVRDSQSTHAGGALENQSGTTTLVDSLIENNQSKFGGGIDSLGTLTLSNTTVRSNTALTNTGGGLRVGGTAVIDNSQIVGNTAYRDGGGILNFGLLTITNSSLSGNSAFTGGGLYNDGPPATLTNVTLNGNTADTAGGGIENFGPLTITDSSLSGNRARLYGGGIDNNGTETLTLVNTTLSGNLAGEGGGIWNDALATLTNVTLSGNRANGDGGGFFNHYTANVYNATIVFNQADSDNDAGGTGGGVYNYTAQTFNLRNSLVAGNQQGNATNDCVGDVGMYGRNLLYVVVGCNLADLGGGTHALIGTLASIGSLQNNGGPTLTHMPRLGSEMIDGGDPGVGCIGPTAALLLFDQRGLPRTIDGDGVGGAVCDVGAVERQLADSDLAPRLWLPLVNR